MRQSQNVAAAPFIPVSPQLFYILLLYGAAILFLVWWPINTGDTDLWYHLAGGRYLFEHGAIAHTSAFSFLVPVREWINYYWLFQGLVYGIYTWTGYYGLLGLRALVYLGTVLLIARYVSVARHRHRAEVWRVLLAVGICLILLPRMEMVRPHAFTYLFMAAFLVSLEFRPRLMIGLPLLAVLWCNLHGITYPILLVICGAYLLEHLIRRSMSRGTPARRGRSVLAPALLSMGAIVLTPHGLALLRVPFTTLGLIGRHIGEFQPFSLEQFTSFQVGALLAPSHQTICNVWLAASCLAVMTSLIRRQARISHLLLWAAGVVLLTRGQRFIYECVLLSVPVLAANPPMVTAGLARRMPRLVGLTLAGVMMLMPLRFLGQRMIHRGKYPMAEVNPDGVDLPRGVTAFLNHVDVGGSVLHHPDVGGYYRWRLHPTYKILMDNEVPFLFTAEELYMGMHAFSEQPVLDSIIRQYEPSFIAVPRHATEAPALLAERPEYVMVYFDEVDVLYVNKRHHRDIAKQYALRVLNPFELDTEGFDDMIDELGSEAVLEEVTRLLQVHPGGVATNWLAALASGKEEAYGEMAEHAQALMTDVPYSAKGYELMGDALRGLGRPEEANAAYQQALFKKADANTKQGIEMKRGIVYREQGQYAQAYHALQRSMGPLSFMTDSELLYQLGSTALLTGKPDVARKMLTHLETYKRAPEDVPWRQKLEEELVSVGDGMLR